MNIDMSNILINESALGKYLQTHKSDRFTPPEILSLLHKFKISPQLVEGSNGQTYLVDFEKCTCTCPYFTHKKQKCKHLAATLTKSQKSALTKSQTPVSDSNDDGVTSISLIKSGKKCKHHTTQYFPDKDAVTTVAVSGSNGQTYLVCLDKKTCTCPSFTNTQKECKHLQSCYRDL